MIGLLSIYAFMQVSAYDFYETNKDGVRIYYDFQNGNFNRVIVAESPLYSYEGVINIPDSVTYEGVRYGVETIGANAFSFCDRLTEVTFPPNMKTIREFAFRRCRNLTSIHATEGVTTIRDRAFSDCGAVKELSFSDNLTAIGANAFEYCKSLESITLGNRVTEIDRQAFVTCESLKSIILPESLKTISEETFLYCNSLTDVSIPNSVTTIRDGAFAACVGLKSFTIPDGVEYIGKDVFFLCSGLEEFIVSDNNKNFATIDGVLTNKEKTILVQFPKAKSSDIIIPESIEIIGERAFEGCVNVNSITMSDHVTTLAPGAFEGCENLKKITLSSNIDSIGSNAFRECKTLESFDFPENITNISDHIFYGCTGLKSVTMSDNVITIGIEAFWNCNILKDMELSKNIISIGDYAFTSCISWANNITLEKVVSIGEWAFWGCGNEELVLGAKLKEIGNAAFVNMLELKVVYNLNPTPIVPQGGLYYIPWNNHYYNIPPPIMYVPVGSGDAYRNIPAWNVFNIEESEHVENEAINRESVTIVPAFGGITINSTAPVQAFIYSITGQMVVQQSFTGRLDIQLQRGLYFVKTNRITKKVMVQ